MKRFCAYLLLLLAASACVRHTVIPDDKLALIFHDAFLTNAYILNDRPLKLDSLKIYEPIFAKYGYTAEDVYYTVGNFSKRKSARLSDVVEKAITQLENESDYYTHEVAILDTIDNVALRTFTHRIYSDTLIRVGRLKDTSRLHFVFDVKPGRYTVKFDYLIDSLDENKQGLGAAMWLETSDSTQTDRFNTYLRRFSKSNVSHEFIADTACRELHIEMPTFRNYHQKPARPSLTVTNFRVDYTPVKEVAVDSLFFKQLDLRIFADEFLPPIDSLPADSLAKSDSL